MFNILLLNIVNYMISKDKIAQNNKFNLSNSINIDRKNKVNINTLLNRVRADKKKEKIEVYLFFGFISLALITTGIIVSF